MIVDIPVPSDFHAAGLAQVYLAWQIAMEAVGELDQAIDYGVDDEDKTRAEHWSRAQPALANGDDLIQQGMELALKGRIAEVSPLLLIGDLGAWPARSAMRSFSPELRSCFH